jgi:HSP20 family protein
VHGLFRDFPSLGPVRVEASGSFPALNAWEDRENIYVEAELPGLAIENLDIQVKGDELTIAGERKPKTADGLTYHRRERGTGAFRRLVRLPVEIDAEKVEASLRDGILTLRLPKAEAVKPRKIEVKVG